MPFEKADLAGFRIYAFHVRRWKRAMLEAYFPQASFVYLPLFLDEATFRRTWQPQIESETGRVAFLVWGNNLPSEMQDYVRAKNMPVFILEDGFIRSLVPSASKTLPLSLTLDRQAAYFDSRSPSDLEDLLANHDFAADPGLMNRARAAVAALIDLRLSKYNAPSREKPLQGDKASGRKRVLVIGQVEDDASIRFGCDRLVTNNDLVRLAAEENPGCDITYKPHPDVLNGVRRQLSDPRDVAHLAKVETGSVSLPDLLDATDHVYTITSLAGFEALLRGLKVTALGCPFYAGWGLTDDRQPNARRGRQLTIEEIFAAAYLLYPRYFNPVDGMEISFEACLSLAAQWRQSGMPGSRIRPVTMPAKQPWSWHGPYGLAGWRHALTPIIGTLLQLGGNGADAQDYRTNPILFFRELSDPRLRKLGRLLYPFD